jgi:ribonuclease P protein component
MDLAAPMVAAPRRFDDHLIRLTRRADFIACSKGPWKARHSVVVQLRDRGDKDAPRVGFTASKKVGNAVARNRAKRRLREAARQILSPIARPGHDYVLVARPPTGAVDWERLLDDLGKALLTLHR